MATRKSIAISKKADSSEVTQADLKSDAILSIAIHHLWPDISVVSEENEVRHCNTTGFFLVDPLDGTKEFINNGLDFTVNVGFVENGTPLWGVVYAPAHDVVFAGMTGKGGWRAKLASQKDYFTPSWEMIQVRKAPKEGLTATISRSHPDPETDSILNTLTITKKIETGSSLKFCQLAEGMADIYPRLGRTMEWDTAAGDAILRAAGGMVKNPSGEPLRYGKPDFINTGFIAWGDTTQ